ncbi:hypothetical protein [Amycolatopsis sp. NBC_00438]|uniref:hypothetical protein n=1 Tax=Amycolatopsis sp. NBC_00438 TaxID=2903558 RepID=UPI002E1B7E3B
MDPTEIGTLPQLAGALDQLRRVRSLSLQALADAAKKLPTLGARRPALPRSTASDLLNAKSVPEAETLVTFLAVCGIREEEAQRPWLQALDRVTNQHHRCPPGAVRVRDAQPRMLGVHAAIQTTRPPEDAQSGPDGGELPPYVSRDFDADLRTKLTRAQHQGGFVLLVGDSSVGKTRALFEAVKAVLPDWWLLHPNDAEALRKFAGHPTGRTVVWLDELQDYLDFAGGVSAGQVRELIVAGVVLVATCWPGEHNKRAALPEDGQPDPYANDRRLLGLADVLHVPTAFSTHERRRAEDLASTDHRIRVALDTPDAGFTQVMAAGPGLIRHWTHAPAYAKAVITAALDARRVGAHAPLTHDYLADAAPSYLNEREVATAPPDWLEHALDYATRLLHGATAALTPVAAGMGTIAGYQVADYLHQHALQLRRREHLPDAAWHALIRHHHPDDTARISDNAERRGREHETVTLYQQLIDDGDDHAAIQLARLLADDGQAEAAIPLLRTPADNDTLHAAYWLADLLAKHGHTAELCARADNGDDSSAYKLAELWATRASTEELRTRADNGDGPAAIRLARVLAEQGCTTELRTRADNGDDHAAIRLARVLAEQGQVEAAILLLRTPARRYTYGAFLLGDLLARQGHIAELRTRADNGDDHAAIRLAELLADQGDSAELRTRADNGDDIAADQLAQLLAEQGHEAELRSRADNGDNHAAIRLAELLAAQGQVEAAISLLRTWADSGVAYAARRLADLLAEHELVEELEREVAAGTIGAVAALRHVRPHAANGRVTDNG